MDFGNLSSTDRNVVIAAAVVVVSAVLSIAYDWGLVMLLPLVAGVGALLVVILPQRGSGASLPGSRGSPRASAVESVGDRCSSSPARWPR